MIRTLGMCLFAAAASGLLAFAQTPSVREHFDHATVLYDWVANSHGEKLRTFITRPSVRRPNDPSAKDSGAHGTLSKAPVIFL